MKQFTHQYKLLKDLPKYKKGWTLGWSGSNQKFYPYKVSNWKMDEGKESIYLDMEHQGYSIDEIINTEWFESVGKLKDFIPQFPSKTKIEEYVDLIPSCHLINDVDECRAINGLLDDNKFQQKLYDFYKESYEEFYKLKV